MGTQDTINYLWKRVRRPGIDNFLEWLNNDDSINPCDFFTAPCSTEFHLCKEGGLAEHSLNVYDLLEEKVRRYGFTEEEISKDTITICALGHDLCKANFYTKGVKNVKIDGRWQEKEVYIVKDQFPMGHGEKSVSILQEFMLLTEVERLAIRWHMQHWDAGIHFFYPSGSAFRAALKLSPLVALLFTADYEASEIIERDSNA